MEPTPQKTQDIVDATDSLEAVDACRSIRFFLFYFMILPALVVLQILFWMNHFGLIEQGNCRTCGAQKVSCQIKHSACPKAEVKAKDSAECPMQAAPKMDGPLPLAATVDIAEEVEKVTEAMEEAQPQTDETEMEKTIVLETQDAVSPAETDEQATDAVPSDAVDIVSMLKISCGFSRGLIAICNFIVLTGAILYSLTLLICLKISLISRLGGIKHIAKAFFISLFLLVILIPWQRLLPGVLIGTVWLPGELFCDTWCKANCTIFWEVLMYLRFCGLWVVALWLLFWSRIRFVKWRYATLRRLGVVR